MVEKDEPIPMVKTKPITNNKKIAKGLLLANQKAELSTRALMWPVCSNTSAKPAAEIIIKPMDAIILIPSAITPSDLFQSTTPVAVNTKKPAMAPTTIDPVYNCIKNVIKIATIATANVVLFFSFGGCMFVGISTGSYCLFLPYLINAINSPHSIPSAGIVIAFMTDTFVISNPASATLPNNILCK